MKKLLLFLLLSVSTFGQYYRYEELLNPPRKATYGVDTDGSEFAQTTAKYIPLGNNIVTAFSSNLWILDAGVTRNGDVAVWNNTPSLRSIYWNYTSYPLTKGKKYKAIFAITSIASGGLYIENGSSPVSSTFTTAGTYSVDFTAIDGTFAIKCSGTTTAQVPYCYLYESTSSLDQFSNNRIISSGNYDFESAVSLGSELNNPASWMNLNYNSYSYSSGTLAVAGIAAQYCRNDVFIFTAGKKYQISYTGSNVTGTHIFRGNTSSTTFHTIQNGVNTFYITTTQDEKVRIMCTADGGATLSNISYKEVLSDWTGTGNHSSYITSEQKHSGTYSLKITSTGTGDASNYVKLDKSKFDALETGKKYTKEFWVYDAGTKLANALTGDNTSFTSSKGSWVDYGAGASTSWETDHLKIVLGASGTTGTRIPFEWTAGKTYYISFKHRFQSGTSGSIGLGDGAGSATSLDVSPTATATVSSKYITPTQNTHYLYILSGTSNSSVYEVDDITVQEIVPTTYYFQIGDVLKSWTLTAGIWQKCPYTFSCTSGTTGQDIKLWASQSSVVYMDDCYVGEFTPMSFMGWFKTTSTSTCIFGKSNGGSSGSVGYMMYMVNGYVRFWCVDGVDRIYLQSPLANDNKWHFYVVTYDASEPTNNYKMYFDGLLYQQSTVTIGNSNTSLSYYIGRYSYTASGYFIGQLGSQVVKRRIVTPEEIARWYRKGSIDKDASDALYIDWRGTSTSEMLQDRSSVGNTLSSSTIDITDRVRTRYK